MGGEQNAPSQLDPREQAQIEHAKVYARDFANAGAPGHGQFMLIAKLAALLEDAVARFGYAPDKSPPVKVQRIMLDAFNVWRDVNTGVKVDLRD